MDNIDNDKLIYAALDGDYLTVKQLVQCLVERGSDINHIDIDGRNALIATSWSQNIEGSITAAKILIDNGINLSHKDKYKKTAFILAAIRGKLPIIIMILDRLGSAMSVNDTDKDGKTALIFASLNGHHEIVDHLISIGANINHLDNDKKSALIYSCQHGHKDITNTLLSHSAIVDSCDKSEKTALLVASANGHLDIVELLCSHGSKVNFQDSVGKTALIYASHHGHINVVDILLFYGANVHHLDKNKKNALVFAKKKKYNRVCEILLYAGAIDTTAIDTTAIDTTAIDTTAIDTTAIDTTAIDTTAIDATAIDKFQLLKPGELKTKVCKNWKGGRCQFGDKCIFVHGDAPILGKERRVCKYWQQGHCSFGSLCMFVHEESLYAGEVEAVTIPQGIPQKIFQLLKEWHSFGGTIDIAAVRRFLISITNCCEIWSIEWNRFCKLVDLIFKKKFSITSRMAFDITQIHQDIIAKASNISQIHISPNIFIDFSINLVANKNNHQDRLIYYMLAHFFIIMFTSMPPEELVLCADADADANADATDANADADATDANADATDANADANADADATELLDFKKMLSLILYIIPSLDKDICCAVTRLLVIGNAYRGTPSIDKRNYIRSCYEIFDSVYKQSVDILPICTGTFCNPFIQTYDDQTRHILLGNLEEKIVPFTRFLPVGSTAQVWIDITSSEYMAIWGIGGISIAQQEDIVETIREHMKKCIAWAINFHKYLIAQNRKFNTREISSTIDTYFKVDYDSLALSISGKNICKCFPDLKFDEIIDSHELAQSTLRLNNWLNISDLYLSQYLFPGYEYELIKFWEEKSKVLGKGDTPTTGIQINSISSDFGLLHVFYDDEKIFNNFQHFIINERDNYLQESLQVHKMMDTKLDTNIAMLYNADDSRPLKLLARNCKVRLLEKKNKPILPLVVLSLCSLNITTFRDNLENPSKYLEELRLAKNEIIHIYTDVSNVMIGAKMGPNGEDHDIMLNPNKVIEVISRGRSIARTIAAGTSPNRYSAFWSQWGEGAVIRHYKKVYNEDGVKCEQGVDELLHIHILEDVLSKNYGGPRRTMLLLSGDGNINEHNEHTNFPRIIDKVLEKSWNVELWCWRRNINSIWLKYANMYGPHFSIHYFDDYRHDVTYINRNSTQLKHAAASSVGSTIKTLEESGIKSLEESAINTLEESGGPTFDITNNSLGMYSKHRIISDEVGHRAWINQNNKSLIYENSADKQKAEETQKQYKELVLSCHCNSNFYSVPEASAIETTTPITIEEVIISLYKFLLTKSNRYMNASEFASFYDAHPECKMLYQAKSKNKKFYSEPLARRLLLWKDIDGVGGMGRVYAISELEEIQPSQLQHTPNDEVISLDEVINTLYTFILNRGGNMDAAAFSLFYHAHPKCRDIYKAKKKAIYNEPLARSLLLWKDEADAPGKGRVYALVNGCIVEDENRR